MASLVRHLPWRIASQPETKDRRHALFMACRDAAKAQGIDLDDFGTSVTVEDFEQVRRALGIARWNVVGNSYGTTVAMTLMARHPKAIRSAVLDSVYPPDLVLPPWSARVAAARTAFFGMCERDPACAVAFPDLAGQYRQTMKRLSHTPMTVSVPAAMHQPDNQAPLTASLFEMVVTLRLYYSENHPDLPRLIATVHDGKVEDFAKALVAFLAGAAEVSDPAHIAVECRDRPHLREPAPAGADTLDQIVDQGICTDWSELGPPPVIPTGTNIPTLVLAGQFDPNASLPLSRHVAELIGDRARWVEFPLMGHNVRHMSPCAASMVAAFIDKAGTSAGHVMRPTGQAHPVLATMTSRLVSACWTLGHSWASAAAFMACVGTAAAQQPATGLVPSYVAGSKDAAGRLMGGTEIRALAAHGGKLFAGNGYWEDRQGPDGTPGAQILVLDGPGAKWHVDAAFNDLLPGGRRRHLAVSALSEATFRTDGRGAALPVPRICPARFDMGHDGHPHGVRARRRHRCMVGDCAGPRSPNAALPAANPGVRDAQGRQHGGGPRVCRGHQRHP